MAIRDFVFNNVGCVIISLVVGIQGFFPIVDITQVPLVSTLQARGVTDDKNWDCEHSPQAVSR
jgi:hypothetical protein